jgi:hypothetical protein
VDGGSGHCWVDGVAAGEAAAGAVEDLVAAAGVVAVQAVEDLADSEAAAAVAGEPPAVGERAS